MAWAALGSDDHPVVLRAVASTAIGGALVGVGAVGPLLRREGGRTLVLVGAVAGVVFHPIAWSVFVLWTWAGTWLDGRVPLGSLAEALLAVLVWSVPSVSYGAVLTVPAMIGASWITRRVLRR